MRTSEKEKFMSVSKQTAFRLTDTAIGYLDSYGEKHNLNRTESIERIIRDHQKRSDTFLDSVAERFLSKFDEKYKNLFTGLRLASRNADVNSDILIEAFNTFFISYQIEKAYTTDTVKSPALEACRTSVKDRIAAYKQKKDDKAAKKDNAGT